MPHTECKDRRAEVISDFIFLGIKPHTLGDMTLAVIADYSERHLEANGLFRSMESGGLLLVELVARVYSLMLGRDITSTLVGVRCVVVSLWWTRCGEVPHPMLKPCILAAR